MLVFAHRGHHVVFPENTLQAFDAAVRLGADGIRTDVRLSGDGVAILFHADQVRGRPVADLSRPDIARICGHPVPTLNEALLRFEKLIWHIDIKAPAAVGAVLQAMTAFAATRRMIVTSAQHELVARCAGVAPVPAGLLLSRAPSDLPALLAAYSASAWLRTLVWDQRILTPTLLRQARAAGWWNFVHGVDDPDSMRLLARYGVDAVITDRPDLVPADVRVPPSPAPRSAGSGDGPAALAREGQGAGAGTSGPVAPPAPAPSLVAEEPLPTLDAAALLRASIKSWSGEDGR